MTLLLSLVLLIGYAYNYQLGFSILTFVWKEKKLTMNYFMFYPNADAFFPGSDPSHVSP